MKAEEQLKETMSKEKLSDDAKKRILAASLRAAEASETAKADTQKPFYMRPLFVRVSSCVAACAVILLIVLAVKNANGVRKDADDRSGSRREADAVSYELAETNEPVAQNLPTIASTMPPVESNALDGVVSDDGDPLYVTVPEGESLNAFVPTYKRDAKARFVCVFPTDYKAQQERFLLVAAPLITDLYVEEPVYFVINSVTEEDGIITVSGYRTDSLGYMAQAEPDGKTSEGKDSDGKAAEMTDPEENDTEAKSTSPYPFGKTPFTRSFQMDPDTGEYVLIK